MKVDNRIWQALWRWARRRHPRKSPRWVRRRYFRSQDHRHWVFATQTRGSNGQPIMLSLVSAARTRIVRHVRIKSDANPFDPAWDSYFAQRQAMRMMERLQGRAFPKRLWQQQDGLCPGCGLPIVEDDRWVINPRIPFKSGGARTFANLKMLHPTCLRSFRVVAGRASGHDHRVPAP